MRRRQTNQRRHIAAVGVDRLHHGLDLRFSECASSAGVGAAVGAPLVCDAVEPPEPCDVLVYSSTPRPPSLRAVDELPATAALFDVIAASRSRFSSVIFLLI